MATTFGLERQSCNEAPVSTSSFGLTSGKNLLPNASFELGGTFQFDEYWQRPTGWAEFYNPLTMNLLYRKQHPARLPSAGKYPGIVHGRQCVHVPLEPDDHGRGQGHLTSSMIAVKPGQAYVLSAYARCTAPGATLRFKLWTRPLDWKEPDDLPYFNYEETQSAPQSEPMRLADRWQRFEFSLVVLSWRQHAVVDLAFIAEGPGNVLVDAVQLEEGFEATEFQTRHPVEASIEDRREEQKCKVFYMDEPLALQLCLYNNRSTPDTSVLKLLVESEQGEPAFSQIISAPIQSGYSEIEVTEDFKVVGDYVARIVTSDGQEIGANRYQFKIQPVIPTKAQHILVAREGRMHQIPAERVWLPWTNAENWYADPPQGLTVTKDDNIYVMFDNSNLLRTGDGGRNWQELKASRLVLAVLRDGSMLNVESQAQAMHVNRSADEGKTWEAIGLIGRPGGASPITELQDGTLVTPIAADPNRCHRSTDGGRTWSQGYPICPGGEAYILELASGRLLCVARYRPQMPRHQWDMWLRYPNSIWWFSRGRSGGYGSHLKCVLLADSDDKGRTWTNVRRGTLLMETMHGSAVELPDGRIVLLHVSRAVSPGGGTWARVSSDGGYTWTDDRYYLNASPSYPGYSASCVLPPHLADGKPGMILTVAGERATGEHAAKAQSVRWRPV